jgi:hypothetical protein
MKYACLRLAYTTYHPDDPFVGWGRDDQNGATNIYVNVWRFYAAVEVVASDEKR